MTPTSSSRLRLDLISLLLVCGGLSLLLVGAGGESGALSNGGVMDVVFSRTSSLLSSIAHAGTINEQPPSMAASRPGAGESPFDSDDDDDAGDGAVLGECKACSDVTRSLTIPRVPRLDPVRSRAFASLPLRAPPL